MRTQVQIIISGLFALLMLSGGLPSWGAPNPDPVLRLAPQPGRIEPIPPAMMDDQPADAAVAVTGISVSPDGQGLVIRTDRPLAKTPARHFSMLKLPNPYRVVIDIPDARLSTMQTRLAINKDGIRDVELAENDSGFYTSVRVTVYVADADTLWEVNTALAENNLTVTMGGMPELAAGKEIPPPVDDGLEIPPGRNVIEDVFYRDDMLYVKARDNAVIRVKDRFVLTDPDRMVIDLENAYIATRAITRPIHVGGSDLRQIRVGQFDEETVRIVLETDRPEAIQTLYPGASRTLMLVSPYLGTSITTLPADVHLANLENVTVEKKDFETVVRIATSDPMVYRLHKDNRQLQIDLLNVAAHPGWVQFDQERHPELAGLKIGALTANQPNSKLVVNLTEKYTEVTPRLSADGKMLELALYPGFAAGHVSKAPYPARIVIDAGHGGKDDGASRAGVKEKDLNLHMARMLKKDLEKRGFKVYMTRETDKFLPLPQITAITNRIRPDLFISIHHNASVNPGLHGIETYYYTWRSRALADKVHRKITNHVDAVDRGVRKAMFYVIHHTPVPAILCEVGYVSNTAERRELLSRERQARTVYGIGEGVVDYLRSRMTAKANP